MVRPLLRAEGLFKSFGALQATCNVSLAVRAGEIHALIGPNGAGKTTLLGQLSGELKPDSGKIEFDGKDITRLPVHKRALLGLARSYQITSVFERLTVRDNILLAIQAHCGHSFRFWRNARTDPQLCENLEAALTRVDLEKRSYLPAGRLSHGEKRQLEVGMALAGNPQMLLLDEPYAGLGPGGTVKLTELIQTLRPQTTIFLVDHDMTVVFGLADRITVLDYGMIVAQGTPDEIRADKAVRTAYLGKETARC